MLVEKRFALKNIVQICNHKITVEFQMRRFKENLWKVGELINGISSKVVSKNSSGRT
jgi:hypothetical protein